MNLNRRKFLKTAAAGAAMLAPAAGAEAKGSPAEIIDAGRRGVLVDTTKCIGCRACEAACAEANTLPDPASLGDDAIFKSTRTMSTNAFTVVNAAATASGAPARFIKRQCMHCVEPACLLVCPFGVPQYEYDSRLPYVRKCTFCADRQANGQAPACASVCPSGALTYGNRNELINVAYERLYAPGSTYLRHIFGEHEVAGTSWMYITDISFERLGLPTDLDTYAYSSLTQASLAAVPFVLTLWPPLLMGIYSFSKRRSELESSQPGEGKHHE
jgi:formate dehydrogenase iron-sulfur subunit